MHMAKCSDCHEDGAPWLETVSYGSHSITIVLCGLEPAGCPDSRMLADPTRTCISPRRRRNGWTTITWLKEMERARRIGSASISYGTTGRVGVVL